MTLLLTGYEPFGDHDVNPSGDLATDLDGATVRGHDVVGRVLPVEYDAAGDRLYSLVREHDPVVVVATGLAAGRNAVSVERVGVNVNDCVGVPDNADAEPRNEPISPDGPDARFSTLPVTAVVDALLSAGIPARLSNTAGTHLCNNALYSTLTALERDDRDVPMGFVHLPMTHEQAAAVAREGEARSGGAVGPSLARSRQRDALVTTFETTLERLER